MPPAFTAPASRSNTIALPLSVELLVSTSASNSDTAASVASLPTTSSSSVPAVPSTVSGLATAAMPERSSTSKSTPNPGAGPFSVARFTVATVPPTAAVPNASARRRTVSWSAPAASTSFGLAPVARRIVSIA